MSPSRDAAGGWRRWVAMVLADGRRRWVAMVTTCPSARRRSSANTSAVTASLLLDSGRRETDMECIARKQHGLLRPLPTASQHAPQANACGARGSRQRSVTRPWGDPPEGSSAAVECNTMNGPDVCALHVER